jgi:hypothetical protein
LFAFNWNRSHTNNNNRGATPATTTTTRNALRHNTASRKLFFSFQPEQEPHQQQQPLSNTNNNKAQRAMLQHNVFCFILPTTSTQHRVDFFPLFFTTTTTQTQATYICKKNYVATHFTRIVSFGEYHTEFDFDQDRVS